MTAASMKAKIEAAMVAAGLTVQEGSANQLLALCTGIIGEIQANGKVQTAIPVQVSTGTGTGATTSTASIT